MREDFVFENFVHHSLINGVDVLKS
jgi:hypothetical protein